MSIRIVIGGLKKEVMERAVRQAGGDHVEVTVTSDFEAAKKIKNGQADYYFGACNSGGGAALSIPIGILGYGNCATVAKAGGRPKQEEIEKLVQQNKVAFGMAVEAIEASVPMLVKALLKKHGLA
ncbi:DUF2620 domain-containing protein [Alicyclobacillus macrosporangiidus]|uniref:DUF2620 domain-containing protein n=1 Tax=Alicyclobacillus macrosporangiidus TaxID=392015 RepID=A0A1I7L918_9BACL|nr:DUF2620 domain-containing protein [Alicyclobacillus macrosporangiidus]SFV06213.1 Protein of unknown function DUF2620 [Alicyclobacillus macrosporangiidus]